MKGARHRAIGREERNAMRIDSARLVFLSLAICLLTATEALGGPCFRGRPKPDCDSFWITEMGLGFRFASNRYADEEWRMTWRDRFWPHIELGWMKNVGD